MFKPGHAPQIGRGKNGLAYIDDFEGSKSGIDLRFPQSVGHWHLLPSVLPIEMERLCFLKEVLIIILNMELTGQKLHGTRLNKRFSSIKDKIIQSEAMLHY